MALVPMGCPVEEITSTVHYQYDYVTSKDTPITIVIYLQQYFSLFDGIILSSTQCTNGIINFMYSTILLSLHFTPYKGFLGCSYFYIKTKNVFTRRSIISRIKILVLIGPTLVKSLLRMPVNNIMVQLKLRKNNVSYNSEAYQLMKRYEAFVPLQEPFFQLKYNTCAIVGNGGSLLNKTMGNTIDLHDAVFRINARPIIDHKSDVGTKTTFMFSATSIKKMCWIWRDESREGKLFKNITYSVYAQVPSRSEYVKWLSCRRKHPHLKFYLISYQWLLLGAVIVSEYTDQPMRVPSTGFVSMMSALTVCNHISMYGFSNNEKTGSHHYFIGQESRTHPWYAHDYTAEQLFYRDVKLKGRIYKKYFWPHTLQKDIKVVFN
jgi:hypothetical protein